MAMTVYPRQLGSVASGVYAGLTDHPPAPAFKSVAGHAADNQPRQLTEKQRKIPLLGLAADRIAEEVRKREQRWLRRLDTIHASGCRTKQQRWDALGALAETILARIDLSNLCLGWYAEDGRFCLNRQRRLAQSGNLSECRVSRTLSALEDAGYVYRRFSRIYKHGQHWITRVTIHMRRQFFVDLGLGHLLAETVARAKAKRDVKLRAIQAKQQQEAMQDLAAAQQRKQSHHQAQSARKAKVVQLDQQREQVRRRDEYDLAQQIAIEHAELSPAQQLELLKKLLNRT